MDCARIGDERSGVRSICWRATFIARMRVDCIVAVGMVLYAKVWSTFFSMSRSRVADVAWAERFGAAEEQVR